MKIDLNVLNHLGLRLYSNIPAVLSEVVANAWDADAEQVDISISNGEIIIKDDGMGMTEADINEKYLLVGFAKREKGEGITPKHKRAVMGRKGIGKLSLFSIARIIEVYTVKNGEANAFRMDADDIEQKIAATNNYSPEEITDAAFDFEQGTKIVLKRLKKTFRPKTLRRKLARRFSVIGHRYNFEVSINGLPITTSDRDYFEKLEYVAYYGEDSQREISAFAKNVVLGELRFNEITAGSDKVKVAGWIGLSLHSGDLQDEDDNLNKVAVFVRGKLADEDVLEDFREGGLFTKFLIGEIEADFLDQDGKPDIATSNRQSIIQDDERYVALISFIKKELNHIEKKSAELKTEQGEKEALKIPAIENWYKELKGDTRSKAKKLLGKINQIAVDDKHKRQLFGHGVLAFESFKYRDSLDALESVSLDNFEEFVKIFREYEEIEATLYYKITKERLEVINRLKEKVHDENALEKVLQELIFENLWLLDTAWDRATETPYMEERVTTAFDKLDAGLTDDERKGRMDIKYKKTSGKHVIIELKRASVKTSTNFLAEQVEKYMFTLEKLLAETEQAHEASLIEAVCVVGQKPTNWQSDSRRELDIQALWKKNIRVVTYQQLIQDASIAYQKYLDASKESGRLIKIIEEIENDLR
jgi:hypothetical protein